MHVKHILNVGMSLSVFVSSIFLSSIPVTAQTAAADDAKRRVNLAGRQRMFSQRMSKASCFIFTGVETDLHRDMLSKTYDLFDETNAALTDGSASLGLISEKHPNVFVSLDRVNNDWGDYGPHLQGVLSGNALDAENINALNKSGLVLLKDMNKAVHIIAKTYGDELPDLPLILAVTIDLAGRQRMFTQKVSKDFCLIDAGIDVEANKEDLATTLQYFNATLDALLQGFAGTVVAPPNEDIRAKLQEVKDLWQGPNAILTAVSEGAAITDEDRLNIVNEVEKVLVAMNEGVKLYEFVDEIPSN